MEHTLHRYFVGVVAFAGGVTLMTLGVLTALVAVAATIAAVYVAGAPSRARRRPAQRTRLKTRPLREEDERHPLVPDDPSLVISAYP
jgi:hypothetical protein